MLSIRKNRKAKTVFMKKKKPVDYERAIREHVYTGKTVK